MRPIALESASESVCVHCILSGNFFKIHILEHHLKPRILKFTAHCWRLKSHTSVLRPHVAGGNHKRCLVSLEDRKRFLNIWSCSERQGLPRKVVSSPGLEESKTNSGHQPSKLC